MSAEREGSDGDTAQQVASNPRKPNQARRRFDVEQFEAETISLLETIERTIEVLREQIPPDPESPRIADVLAILATFADICSSAKNSVRIARNYDINPRLANSLMTTVAQAVEETDRTLLAGAESLASVYLILRSAMSKFRQIDVADGLIRADIRKQDLDRAQELHNLSEYATRSARRAEHAIADIDRRIATLQEVLSREEVKIENILTEISRFREAETDALRLELQSIQEEKIRVLSSAQEAIAQAVSATREKEAEEAREHIEQLGTLLENGKLTASAVANEKVAGHYQRTGDKEVDAARRWTKLAVVTGAIISIAVVSIVIISMYRPVEGTFAAVLRIFAPLIGSPIFVYATLEARSHRRRAWHLTDYAIAHNTMGAMIAPLPKEMQHSILHQAARRMYVSPTDDALGSETKSERVESSGSAE